MQVIDFNTLCQRYNMRKSKVRQLIREGVFKPMTTPNERSRGKGSVFYFLDEQCDEALRNLFK